MNRSRLCQLAWRELCALSAAQTQAKTDELYNSLTVQPSVSCQEKKLCVMASHLLDTPPIHHIPKYSSQLLGTVSSHYIINQKKIQERPFKKKSFLIYPECTERITWACFSTNSNKYFCPQPVLINNFSIGKHNPACKKKKKYNRILSLSLSP